MPAPKPTSPLRVLVVDANGDAADSLRSLLELWGYDVRVEYDGTAAPIIAGAFRPHVVIIDLDTPYLHGSELAARLRADPDFGDVHLVATSASLEEAEVREGLFHDVLAKPFNLSMLETMLATCAAKVSE